MLEEGRHSIPGPVGGMWSSGLVDKSQHYVIYHRHIPHTLADLHWLKMQCSSQNDCFSQLNLTLTIAGIWLLTS